MQPSPRPRFRFPYRLTRSGAALAAVVLCAGVSAHAALRAIAAVQDDTPQPVVLASFERDDHFPGAAALYAEEDAAAPAPGVTGTAALPMLPEGLAGYPLPSGDTSVTPARPFSLARASATDRARALQCLTTAIYYEAATEPDDGQRAVAQVILNRVRHPAFPATVCGVIYQGSERTTGCQFSYACDGSMARAPNPAYWRRAARVAAAALLGHVHAPVGLATHYHTYAVKPGWNRSLVMTGVAGAHFFHRWKGYWGTPVAFTQVYRGGEPLPGPHLRAAAPSAITAAAVAVPSVAVGKPATGVPSPSPYTPAANIQPAYAGASMVRDAARADDSQILDRWKDSGKPLR